jgi:hypothetical protein
MTIKCYYASIHVHNTLQLVESFHFAFIFEVVGLSTWLGLDLPEAEDM